MDMKEIEKIQNLIKKAELQNAKNEGIIESINKEWNEKYGTSDITKIKNHLNELEAELYKSNERLEKLYNDLISSYDWNSLAEELGD